MSVEERFPVVTAEESVINRDWAAGSSKHIVSKEFLIKRAGSTYIGVIEPVVYPPSLWKIIDEPIVNALDHMVRCMDGPNPVTCIKVNITSSGRIRVYNNGPGIEIVVHKTASAKMGKEIWLPTWVFGALFQGSNRNQSDDSVVGGANGLGSKLTNCFAIDFIAETATETMYFLQQWQNHKEIERPPKIINLANANTLSATRKVPHTMLDFMPDYAGLFGYKSFAEVSTVLVDLIRTRMFMACAYAQYTVSRSKLGRPVEVYFNDEKINIRGIHDIANLFFAGKTNICARIEPKIHANFPQYKYPWEICVVIGDFSAAPATQMANVNGIVVRSGKHYDHLLKVVVSSVQDRLSKSISEQKIKFSQTIVEKNIFIFMNTAIPGVSWTGQRKDVLDIDVARLVGYSLPKNMIDSISDHLRDQIIDSIFTESEATGRKKKKKTTYEKYRAARWAGTKRSRDAMLIAGEGDSALARICVGISTGLNWDKYGAISLGGVIMNTRKATKKVETATGQYLAKNKKLDKNIFMNVLAEVTGLNTSYAYDPNSPSYKKEMNELHYGGIIACVDQDLDGKGNILGLLLNTFELFWPNLLKAGYVKWACTPIMRAYPKAGGKVVEFYSIEEFKKWSNASDVARFNIRYYKGLGTHSREEIVSIFKKFDANVYTYYVDDRTKQLFEIYFGKEADLRKAELSQVSKYMTPELSEMQSKSKLISCSDHLEYETNPYQKDNLERKLDSYVDGQNQAGRKILDGLLEILKGNSEYKVAQLAGFVSKHENYAHGEDGLGDSITRKGFVAVGGKQLPIIVPLSNFGSRLGGGKDAASTRYIRARLNKNIVNLIFPAIDYWILPFNFDEGERCEPKYFVPIIPMAVIESTELPSHGWKLKTWGRDVYEVIKNVRRLIWLGDDASLLHMGPNRYAGGPYEWKGTLKTIRGKPYSFGKYEYDPVKNMIIITELPLRVWNSVYVKNISKTMAEDSRVISTINDVSSDIVVKIEIKLKKDAMDIIKTFADDIWSDGVEEYFQLRDSMDSHLNMMGIAGDVISFTKYEDIISKWFPHRKQFYIQRVERQRILLNLDILRLENILRYADLHPRLGLSKLKKINMEQILVENNFDKIHVGKINNPKFLETAELENIILRGPKANYDYLLGLSDLKRSHESIQVITAELEKARNNLTNHTEMMGKGRFPGALIWERELNELEVQIREGVRTAWMYSDVNKYNLD